MALLLPGMFEFAAPPRTGVHWFVQACREAGLLLLPDEGSVTASFCLWSEQSKDDKSELRVTLVRHPCDWLRSVFDAFWAGLQFDNVGLKCLWSQQFVNLPKNDFDSFTTSYLETMPGEIGRIFDSCKADTRLRLEDMPWALVELLESLGVEQKALDRVIALPPQAKSPFLYARSKWRPELRRRLLESEADFCQKLDYY